MKTKQKISSIILVLAMVLSMNTLVLAGPPDTSQKDFLKSIIEDSEIVQDFKNEIIAEVVEHDSKKESLLREELGNLASELPDDSGGIGLFLCFLEIVEFPELAEEVFGYYAVNHFLTRMWNNGNPSSSIWDYEKEEWIEGVPLGLRCSGYGDGVWVIDQSITPSGVLGEISVELLSYETIKQAMLNPEFYDIFKRIYPDKACPATRPPEGPTTPGTSPGTVIPPIVPPLIPKPFIEDHVSYIIGYPDGNVRPSQNITRAEVATVFYRLLNNDVRMEYWTQENLYSDVNTGDWFNNCISVMTRLGILCGYDGATFRPNHDITRAELAGIAGRFARMMKISGDNDVYFGDIQGHWGENEIMLAAKIGWVLGYPDGTYRPDEPIKRSEFMTLVNRMLERMPENESDLLAGQMKTWPDNSNKDAWYYLAVQEATNSHEANYKEEKVPGLPFQYEYWTKMMENPDWLALEKVWTVDGYLANARVNEEISSRLASEGE